MAGSSLAPRHPHRAEAGSDSQLALKVRSASGTWRTSMPTLSMSAIGVKADIPDPRFDVR
jgi:hypothetical protein